MPAAIAPVKPVVSRIGENILSERLKDVKQATIDRSVYGEFARLWGNTETLLSSVPIDNDLESARFAYLRDNMTGFKFKKIDLSLLHGKGVISVPARELGSSGLCMVKKSDVLGKRCAGVQIVQVISGSTIAVCDNQKIGKITIGGLAAAGIDYKGDLLKCKNVKIKGVVSNPVGAIRIFCKCVSGEYSNKQHSYVLD